MQQNEKSSQVTISVDGQHTSATCARPVSAGWLCVAVCSWLATWCSLEQYPTFLQPEHTLVPGLPQSGQTRRGTPPLLPSLPPTLLATGTVATSADMARRLIQANVK